METRSAQGIRPIADGIGIVGSAVCALHCVAAPALLVAGTALPAAIAPDETFHRTMLWLILPASALAFGLGCWLHKDRRVFSLGALGLAGLVASAALPHEALGETGERLVTLGSAGLLISAHVRNFRRCRAEACAHDGDRCG